MLQKYDSVASRSAVPLLGNSRLRLYNISNRNLDAVAKPRLSKWKDMMPGHHHTHLISMSITLCATLSLAPIGDSMPTAAQQVNQAVPAIDEAAKANDAYQAKDWGKAVLLYQQLTLHQPRNGCPWYRLAASLHAFEKQDDAIATYQKSMEVGVSPAIAEYGIALAYASKHGSEKAFQYLRKAAQDGFSEPERLTSGQELSLLRPDARFAKIVEQATHNLKPCAYIH
jgi:tetratricopeptide (TPR) repeat protein